MGVLKKFFLMENPKNLEFDLRLKEQLADYCKRIADLELEHCRWSRFLLRISNLQWNGKGRLWDFVLEWLARTFHLLGPWRKGIREVFQLRRKHGRIPTIVIRFGNVDTMQKVCSLAPSALRGKSGRVVMGRYFNKSIIESTYQLVFNYRKKYPIVKVNWLQRNPVILYGCQARLKCFVVYLPRL